MARLTADRWRTLSPYLDEALDIPSEERARGSRRLCARRDARRRSAPAARRTRRRPRVAFPRSAMRCRATRRRRRRWRVRCSAPTGWCRRSVRAAMGSVWLAERCDGRFEGRAAVKLLNIALMGAWPGVTRPVPARGDDSRARHAPTHRASHRRGRVADRPAVSRPRARGRRRASTGTATSTRSASRRVSACFSTCSRRSRTRTPT